MGEAALRGYLPRCASMLQGPAPAAEKYSHRKQYSTAATPPLTVGQKLWGA
jgi:hypothetical protein